MKIGQTVYLRPNPMGNAFRRNQNPIEAVVVKIGRKYVTLSNRLEFVIETGRQKTQGSSDYTMYVSKQELDDVLEKEHLKSKIKNAIPKYGEWTISLDKLREIDKILTNKP